MMFVVTEGHLSGTKRVVFWSARNETKRNEGCRENPSYQGKQGYFWASKASQGAHVLEEGKQAFYNGSPLMKKVRGSNGSQNIEEIPHYNKEVYYGN